MGFFGKIFGKRQPDQSQPPRQVSNAFDSTVDTIYVYLKKPENAGTLRRVVEELETFDRYHVAEKLRDQMQIPSNISMAYPRDFYECLDAALARLRRENLLFVPEDDTAPLGVAHAPTVLYDVVIEDIGIRAYSVGKAVEELTSLGYFETTDLLRKLPATILKGVPKAAAEAAQQRLVKEEAVVQIVASRVAATPTPPAASPQPAQAYDVVLTRTGDKKINVIKVLRGLTRLGLKEVKDLSEKNPAVVLRGISLTAAESARTELEQAGATVQIVASGEALSADFHPAPASGQIVGDYDVILEDIGRKKINVIKIIREYTGLGLKDAKDLADTPPATILRGVGLNRAHTARDALEAEGATVRIVDSMGFRSTDSVSAVSVSSGGMWDVVLVDPGQNKIGVIKIIREYTGLGLKDAKDLAEQCPATVLDSVSQPKAEECKTALVRAGGIVKLVEQ